MHVGETDPRTPMGPADRAYGKGNGQDTKYLEKQQQQQEQQKKC